MKLNREKQSAMAKNIQNFSRLKIVIKGIVQGVGFRPFIYKLANRFQLKGWVKNSCQGVFIEVEGEKNRLEKFLCEIDKQKPKISFIQSLESFFLEQTGYKNFEILKSDDNGEKNVCILPDIATCQDCLNDIFDQDNRRYLYPFTNCTNCGPRFSIMRGLPYDRKNTTMKRFKMCFDCQREYEDPANRRFHAQPNACPKCGPHLELVNLQGEVIASHHDVIIQASVALKKGLILALKGLGGYQFLVDARNEKAVSTLRNRKKRNEKPFALMAPDLDHVEKICEVSDLEKRTLLSTESPILLLKKRGQDKLVPNVAPRNPYLGIMLPYTPLHHILLKEFGSMVVATSGNISDEPICLDENEALEKLKGIADIFINHNRPIVRQVDDSIVRIVNDRELLLRRARGYAPLPLHLKNDYPKILAVGGHLKNTFSVLINKELFVGQHIGDLNNSQALSSFEREVECFLSIFDFKPEYVAHDKHPDYESTKWAQKNSIPKFEIPHHMAHIFSCMAENELTPPLLGISWDGTGFGDDGTIWGGEFFKVNGGNDIKRAVYFRPFMLPGGDKAIQEPRRSALGVLYEIWKDDIPTSEIATVKVFSESELKNLTIMMKKNINSPYTSSVGRLFDAVASLIDLGHHTSFEGQHAMALEFIIAKTEDRYSFDIIDKKIVDWEPLIKEIIRDYALGVDRSVISAKFHNTLVEIIVDVAKIIGEKRIAFSGGCFQNKYLLEKGVARLKEEGFVPFWNQRIPPNDGGISVGQAYGAAIMLND